MSIPKFGILKKPFITILFLTVGGGPSREDVIEGVNPAPLKLKRRIFPRVKNTSKSNKKKKKNISAAERRCKRGQYASYDPTLRAEIAKYASEHGNMETTNYFREKLSLESKFFLKIKNKTRGSASQISATQYEISQSSIPGPYYNIGPFSIQTLSI
jgi:hypothetical protein